jgi:hypothetical protein
MDLGEYLRKVYVRPLVCTLPVIPLGYAFTRLEHASWLLFTAEAAAICAVFAAASYMVCLDSGQRALVAGRVGAAFRREALMRGA